MVKKNIIGVSIYFIAFCCLIDRCKLKVLNLVIMSIHSKNKNVVACIDITVNQNNRLKNSTKFNL